MNYIIQKDCETPAYLQLYRLIRDDIIRGVYPWGNRLPSPGPPRPRPASAP